MDGLDIVKILGVGLSGFGFLLMYLAYKLIQSLVPLPNANPMVISTINRYMFVCFIMTLTVGVFTFITTSYKNDVIEKQSAKIENSAVALNLLAASQKNNLLSDSIVQLSQNKARTPVKNEQEKILDTLSKYVAKQNNPHLIKTFKNYKSSVLSISDSLFMTNLDKSKIDSLKKNYILLNDSISDFSLKVANNKISEINKKVIF